MSFLLDTPAAPKVEKVTHHSVQLEWDETLDELAQEGLIGDDRARVVLQQENGNLQWFQVYTGYAGRHTIENLDPSSIYSFRLKVIVSEQESSDWSPFVTITTNKEPMTGIHLHRAVAMNDGMGTERILELGEVNIEVTDKYGFTPLMQAANRGYTEVMEVLLRHHADVNVQNDAGKTALMLATFAGKIEACSVLRESGARYEIQDKGGSTALHWAVDGQSLECIEWCIDDGWNIDIKDSGSQWTPLIRCAAVNGNKDVARILIKSGASVNAVDADGKTALMIAVINGHQSLVELLLLSGADLSVKNAFGKTAYEMALSMEKRRITRLLEEHMEKRRMPSR